MQLPARWVLPEVLCRVAELVLLLQLGPLGADLPRVQLTRGSGAAARTACNCCCAKRGPRAVVTKCLAVPLREVLAVVAEVQLEAERLRVEIGPACSNCRWWC